MIAAWVVLVMSLVCRLVSWSCDRHLGGASVLLISSDASDTIANAAGDEAEPIGETLMMIAHSGKY